MVKRFFDICDLFSQTFVKKHGTRKEKQFLKFRNKTSNCMCVFSFTCLKFTCRVTSKCLTDVGSLVVGSVFCLNNDCRSLGEYRRRSVTRERCPLEAKIDDCGVRVKRTNT